MPRKLRLEQAINKLSKNFNEKWIRDNIFDEVLDGNLDMYVDAATWEYDSPNNNDEISIYLGSGNITTTIPNYKVQNSDLFWIKRSIRANKGTFNPSIPSYRSEEYSGLIKDIKEQITFKLECLHGLYWKILLLRNYKEKIPEKLYYQCSTLQELIKCSNKHKEKNEPFYWRYDVRFFLPLPLLERKKSEKDINQSKARIEKFCWPGEYKTIPKPPLKMKEKGGLKPFSFELKYPNPYPVDYNFYGGSISINPFPKNNSRSISLDEIYFFSNDIEKLCKDSKQGAGQTLKDRVDSYHIFIQNYTKPFPGALTREGAWNVLSNHDFGSFPPTSLGTMKSFYREINLSFR